MGVSCDIRGLFFDLSERRAKRSSAGTPIFALALWYVSAFAGTCAFNWHTRGNHAPVMVVWRVRPPLRTH